jgi:hypothetical protein
MIRMTDLWKTVHVLDQVAAVINNSNDIKQDFFYLEFAIEIVKLWKLWNSNFCVLQYYYTLKYNYYST